MDKQCKAAQQHRLVKKAGIPASTKTKCLQKEHSLVTRLPKQALLEQFSAVLQYKQQHS